MVAVEKWDIELTQWRRPAAEVIGSHDTPRSDGAVRTRPRRRTAAVADSTGSPSHRRTVEALRPGGTVLDVGCGAGAASLPPAAEVGRVRVTGVDPLPQVLETFAGRARSAGVRTSEVRGLWPDAMPMVDDADVVVCHNVLYYAEAFGPFVDALDRRARRRVVIEIPAEHPHAWMRPLWSALRDRTPPPGPSAEDAVVALAERGLTAEVEYWSVGATPWEGREDELAGHVCDRMGLPPERVPEVRTLLGELELPPPERRMATLWWPGSA